MLGTLVGTGDRKMKTSFFPWKTKNKKKRRDQVS